MSMVGTLSHAPVHSTAAWLWVSLAHVVDHGLIMLSLGDVILGKLLFFKLQLYVVINDFIDP